MTLGLRGLLLVVAIILFVIAAFSDANWSDLVAIGLACFAGALLVEELGVAGVRFGAASRNR